MLDLVRRELGDHVVPELRRESFSHDGQTLSRSSGKSQVVCGSRSKMRRRGRVDSEPHALLPLGCLC